VPYLALRLVCIDIVDWKQDTNDWYFYILNLITKRKHGTEKYGFKNQIIPLILSCYLFQLLFGHKRFIKQNVFVRTTQTVIEFYNCLLVMILYGSFCHWAFKPDHVFLVYVRYILAMYIHNVIVYRRRLVHVAGVVRLSPHRKFWFESQEPEVWQSRSVSLWRLLYRGPRAVQAV